jgi:hypothetical protein
MEKLIIALAALVQDKRLELSGRWCAGPDGLLAGEARHARPPPNTLSFHFDRLRQAASSPCGEGRR